MRTLYCKRTLGTYPAMVLQKTMDEAEERCVSPLWRSIQEFTPANMERFAQSVQNGLEKKEHIYEQSLCSQVR